MAKYDNFKLTSNLAVKVRLGNDGMKIFVILCDIAQKIEINLCMIFINHFELSFVLNNFMIIGYSINRIYFLLILKKLQNTTVLSKEFAFLPMCGDKMKLIDFDVNPICAISLSRIGMTQVANWSSAEQNWFEKKLQNGLKNAMHLVEPHLIFCTKKQLLFLIHSAKCCKKKGNCRKRSTWTFCFCQNSNNWKW